MTTSDITLAVVLENVLLDIASLGLIIAKSSLVVFIMRLIPQHQSVWKWRALLILPMLVLGIVSFGAMMAMWARCFTALAGTTLLCSSVIPAMHWMQITAGISIATDFWYASMPWYLLHRLQRPRREKLLIQGSMSLGVIAAGCGIARALTIYGALNNSEAQSAAVLYLWHGAEMAVTMICIGLPVCRPAYISIMTACGIQPRKANTSNRYGSYAGTYGLGRTIGSKYGEQTRGESDAWSQRRILADANVVSTRESYRLTSLSKTGITVTKTVDVVKQSPV
ncbi:hypothetical protein SLS53_001358 [Cytospora paraplurivora]|uniref:Rhodopsin domain-containing protein n=1 Tax=Cytospora paraplurivora TaxID=2898453 RepID=A0AAN9UHU5_9PEZI